MCGRYALAQEHEALKVRFGFSDDLTSSFHQSPRYNIAPTQLAAVITNGTGAKLSGMRRGEILNLKWDDPDLKHGILFIRDSKNGEKREIPICVALAKAVRDLPRKSKFVFSFGDGQRMVRAREGFERAVRRAGILNFTFHDLRHTFASHLVMSGVDLLTVKELLGLDSAP